MATGLLRMHPGLGVLDCSLPAGRAHHTQHCPASAGSQALPQTLGWVQSISAEVVGPGCASQGGHCFRTLQPALLLLCRKLCQPQSTGGLPGDLAASSPPGEHGSSASPPQVGAAGREGGRASTEAVGLTLLLGEPVGPITQGWRVFSKA